MTVGGGGIPWLTTDPAAEAKVLRSQRQMDALGMLGGGIKRGAKNYLKGGLRGMVDPEYAEEQGKAAQEDAELSARLGEQTDKAQVQSTPSGEQQKLEPTTPLGEVAKFAGGVGDWAKKIYRGPGKHVDLTELARKRGRVKALEDRIKGRIKPLEPSAKDEFYLEERAAAEAENRPIDWGKIQRNRDAAAARKRSEKAAEAERERGAKFTDWERRQAREEVDWERRQAREEADWRRREQYEQEHPEAEKPPKPGREPKPDKFQRQWDLATQAEIRETGNQNPSEYAISKRFRKMFERPPRTPAAKAAPPVGGRTQGERREARDQAWLQAGMPEGEIVTPGQLKTYQELGSGNEPNGWDEEKAKRNYRPPEAGGAPATANPPLQHQQSDKPPGQVDQRAATPEPNPATQHKVPTNRDVPAPPGKPPVEFEEEYEEEEGEE